MDLKIKTSAKAFEAANFAIGQYIRDYKDGHLYPCSVNKSITVTDLSRMKAFRKSLLKAWKNFHREEGRK